jgi:hypothetical protein
MVEEKSCAEQSEETHESLTVVAMVERVHVFVGERLQRASSVIEQITDGRDVLVDMIGRRDSMSGRVKTSPTIERILRRGCLAEFSGTRACNAETFKPMTWINQYNGVEV